MFSPRSVAGGFLTKPHTPSAHNVPSPSHPCTPNKNVMKAKPSPPATPTAPKTPTRVPTTVSDAFITSSPRSAKKQKQSKLSKLRINASPSKTMFSPPYSKALGFGVKRTASPKSEIYSVESSPVRQRLQHNLALHGNKEQEFDEYDDDFDPWKFIAMLPPASQRKPLVHHCVPPKTCTKDVTLVLDLDETLVHCSTQPNEIINADFRFEVEFNGELYNVAAKKRPGFEEFLDFVSEHFEVIVFTASQRVYADKLLDILDPGRRYIKHRVFRDDCVNVSGNYLKDLTVIGRDLKKVIIVDNSPQAFSYQIDNGIPILSWFESDEDTELYKVTALLTQILRYNAECANFDVRQVLKEHFKLYRKVEQRGKELKATGTVLKDWM